MTCEAGGSISCYLEAGPHLTPASELGALEGVALPSRESSCLGGSMRGVQAVGWVRRLQRSR